MEEHELTLHLRAESVGFVALCMAIGFDMVTPDSPFSSRMLSEVGVELVELSADESTLDTESSPSLLSDKAQPESPPLTFRFFKMPFLGLFVESNTGVMILSGCDLSIMSALNTVSSSK